MFSRNPSSAARYTFTVLVVLLSTLLRFALDPVLDLKAPFILYFPTVVVCAWFGGLGPGLLSAALGGVIAWFVFFPPQYSFTVTDETALTQLIIYSLGGVLISLLAESLHRARRKIEASEAEAREQREQYRITLASIGDAVIAADAEGQVTFMNKVAESLTGWKNAEAAGQPLDEVFHIVNEQTRLPVENPALRAIKEGVILGLANHTLLIAKDGTERPIDDSGAPIKDAHGKTLGAVLIFRDITERRRAEKERALLADIVASSEDAIISKNLDGLVESWNAAAERLFEYTANEMRGQPITLIVPPDQLEEEQMILERLRRGERVEHFETVRRAKSGRSVDISLTVSPVRDAAGRIIGASKIVRDITARKRAEEALQQQREWLRVTLTSIGDAVITTDTNGDVTFLNPVAESLTGWKQEEAQGQPLPTVFHIVNEYTRQPVENPALRAIREGKVVGLANHTVLIAKDGTETPIDDSGAPIQDEGKILGAVLIFRDITERRQAEEALRTSERRLELALTAGQMGAWEWDIASSKVAWSPGLEAIHGLKPGTFGGTFEDFQSDIHSEDMASVRAQIQQALETLQDYHIIYRITRLDGALRYLEAFGRFVLDANGKPQKLAGVCMDITERKHVEEERAKLLASERAAREQAEAASRAKDEFVAMISHEIRAPLNSILGWAQMLRTGKFDGAETTRAIEIIERSARAQLQLIEDLLDMSRVITGKLKLNVRAVELAGIIEAALDIIRPAAEAKAIELQVQLSSQGSLVSGDPNRLQQIIWNLLSNAVKFTPQRGRIQVKMERTDLHLQVTVSDSGAGISPEFLPYVFDRFSQANTSSERKYGGLGLGLAIVRHLVELHGGTVRAESAGEGLGATFTIMLPARAVEEQRRELERATAGIEHFDAFTEAISLDGLRVMVVDDEAESRELLQTILKQRGAEVKTCASAAEALAAIEQWQPLVLISDIGMPEEDGYAFIRKLRALAPARGGNIPAVALTGYARSEDRTRVLTAGFQMHVPKPVEAVELIMVVASLAGRVGKGRIE